MKMVTTKKTTTTRANLPALPAEQLSPEMAAWANAVKSRHADLHAANTRLRDTLIEIEAARSRASNEPPDDFLPLKRAAAHVPHVDPEWIRRRCQSGEIEMKQRGKKNLISVGVASMLRVVRERWG
jgi:hypothetical protein